MQEGPRRVFILSPAMLDDFTALTIMLKCAGKVLDYAAEGQRAFEESPMMREAIVYNLETMGRVSRAVSEGTKQAAPEIPWSGLERIKSLIYDEFTGYLDEDEVWSIIETDLSDLYADLGVLGLTEG